MKYVPHEYQSYATQFILDHPVAAILLQMGLGKSVITLTAIRELLEKGETRRVLVIAPLRVARDTWPEEIRKWDHLKGMTYSVAVGTADERRKALAVSSQVTLINRENVPWLVEASVLQHGKCLPCYSRPTLQGPAEARLDNGDRRPASAGGGKIPFDYDMIVIDELSSFKNWEAKRFRALMKVRPLVKRIVGLTGTPSPNG
jgi:SNF2 family DNA or RNA helicase